MPQPGTRAVYDSVYLETGFTSIEGPSLKEMEQRKVCDRLVMYWVIQMLHGMNYKLNTPLTCVAVHHKFDA